MPDAPPAAIQLSFKMTDPTTPDLAAVGAAARAVTQSLRTTGETVTASYTGEKGAGDAFLWVMAVSVTLQGLIAIPDFALKVAQLLNEIKKLRGGAGTEAEANDPAPQVIIIYAGERCVTLPSNTKPVDKTLLSNLLATQLPTEINPADVAIEVQVPPTPQNTI